jgi:CDP-glucose 4,6-dehydratase
MEFWSGSLEGVVMDNSFWLDRPVFVTGGTGLVGSWLIKHLLERGADIVCLVRDWVPQSELVRDRQIEKVKVVRGDVRDQELLERVLGEFEIDTVIHLAAQTIVTIANRNPISTFETNIGGTWALLEACRRSPKVKQIIVASSDKAYGDQLILPYTEATALAGQHPYDVSKSCADLIAQTYAKTYDLPVAITRCGNWNRIVPGTIRSVLRGQNPVIRSDGKFIRDYFYVEDGAEAYIALAEALAAQPQLRGEAFNFSYENPQSVNDIVTKILSLMGAAFAPEILNETNNEILAQSLDSHKARQVLNWSPEFGYEEGLQKTIAWYKEYFC